MRECEEADNLYGSWASPGKRKRKGESKNGTKCQKRKNNSTAKTDENTQKKKKKKNKFKEVMVGRIAKKKEKKKKKNRLGLEQGDSFILTQSSNNKTKPAGRPETLSMLSDDKVKPDHLTQDSKKKSKREKKVVFDLSPGYICVKRPKFVSPSLQCPKHSTLLEHEAVSPRESCSQVTVTGHSWGETHVDESQCINEDINSQDLFITQKTFRASPLEPSSGEASDEAVYASPQTFTQEKKLHMHPRDSHVHQHHRKTDKHTVKTHINPGAVNPEPADANPSLDAEKLKEQSWSQQFMISTSTQTDNMFTTELSSYLQFHQKCRVTSPREDLKPLDLSLPQRARKDLMIEGDSIWHSSCSSGMKHIEIKQEPSLRHRCSESTHGKGETTLSQSESADTTTSSEDNELPCRTGKLDLTQVRAVQMRLNESFFFKTKGEGQSPRPESPLMKLAQGRDVKSRKSH